MHITKGTKLQLWCHCHDNNYAAGLVLIASKIPRFHITQGSCTPNNLMGRVKTMWEPCLFQGRPPVSLRKVANVDIWLFTERDWSQGCCHGNNITGVILFLLWFVMYISGVKFEDHCFNISGDILNSVFYCFSWTIYDVITFLIPKRKTPFFFTLKSLSNKQQLFFTS